MARLGAYGGPRLERLWVQTNTERLYLWDWAAACNEGAEGATRSLACAAPACRGCLRIGGLGCPLNMQATAYLLAPSCL